MKTFSEWKLLREERDIGQSVNNALMYVDNPQIFSGIIQGCLQQAQGNQTVIKLLHDLSDLPNAVSNARRQGRDPNQMLANARGTVQQIKSAMSPEAAAYNSGRQGVGMMGQQNNPVNVAAHQRGQMANQR